MHWTPRRETFRTLLTDGCYHPASVFDPMSARAADALGFEMAMFAGSVASHTVLGAPDLIVLTLSEFADQALRINRAATLPLVVDADHGYGNALSVRRTVEELETAGVSALTIEDTELPRPYGRASGLVSIDEARGKMRAALAGRSDPSLVVLGRTSLRHTTLDDAIARGRAYAECGVDAVMFVGVPDAEALRAISAAIDVPIMLGGAHASLHDRERLAAAGVRICLQGHQPFAAAVQATYATLAALRDGTAPADLAGLPDKALMATLEDAAGYRQAQAQWLEP